jgi:hypothetical protein
MSLHAKTLALIETAVEILREHNPMTVRQVYYQLVSRQVIKNNRTEYQAVSNALVKARKDETIPWEWIEDRLRRPRSVSMWSGTKPFLNEAQFWYRRDVWAAQPRYVECWLEKDALSGVFEDVLDAYGVTLNVGRGYDGWSSLCNAANRYEVRRRVTVLYFGDFDPSGEDMFYSLRERLEFFGTCPEFVKCALTRNDIARYNLPADFTKAKDTRREAFIAEHGDNCVELDALPVGVLRQRIIDEVEKRMDLRALARVRNKEARERKEIAQLLSR